MADAAGATGGRISVPSPQARRLAVDTSTSRTWRRFRRHKLATAGAVFIAVLVILGIAAPIVAPIAPTETDPTQVLVSPNRTHWLGTDPVGRDVWSRVVYAIRVSLSVGFVAVGISVAISLVLGSLAGFYGHRVDMVIMRLTDVVMAIPGLMIIMAVVSLTGPSIYNVMIAIGVLSWPAMTRLLRAQILSARERDYVVAARCLGTPNFRIMLVHVLPNCVAPLLVAATFGIAEAILTEASLSFLGFGVLPPTPSWGNMLNAARSFSRLQQNPWFWAPPGAMILLTVLAINFIGDGLRDALDPRRRDQ